ncbi:MAG: sn-glycerol-3-phosphate ABC transporter ATP-binding protein UgpC [Armatimonadetes bacterium]|nr:sn-glycerol-3-phosphate ABC transporter ATP-binding protein UgpC [Armatimonadota bacterium]
MAGVKFQNVSKVFGKDVKAVDNLNLDIRDGEFMVLVGPSGCGKTTALRMIAGLEESTGGDLCIGDQRVNDVPPKDRDIAMVFQNYALYPHMTVYDNIAFGLRIRELKGIFWQLSHMSDAQRIKQDIDKRVRDAAKMLSIDHLLARKPKELSGGQRQRVALGRAIVRKPKVFLMDEPLSNLDAKLRIQTRAELIRLHRSLGITTIYVTHDQVEAMTMGQRIAVMKDGVLQQCAEPETVYNQPANKFVAGFIGAPPMNFMEATIKNDGQLRVDVGEFSLPLPAEHPAKALVNKPVTLGIRPESIFDANLNNPVAGTDANTVEAKVDVLEPLGPEYTAYLNIGKHNLLATIDSATKIKEGGASKFVINLDSIHIFDGETEVAVR